MTPEEKMFEAVQREDNNFFRNLPENININAQDDRGDTLLHKLVKTEYVPCALPSILKRNPNPFIENNDAMTPRMLAVWRGATSQAAFLAAYEASYAEKQRKIHIAQQSEALAIVVGVLKTPESAELLGKNAQILSEHLGRLAIQMMARLKVRTKN